MKNEPAFPTNKLQSNKDGEVRQVYCHGLTKLEWFAGMALSGLMAKGHNREYAAGTSFDRAEAMLKESERRQKDE